jgi:Fur family ferric uptake transcriptional regulator
VMTVPTETRPLAAASIPAAITTLRVRGLRVSAARRLVLEALFAAEGPVTAEAIASGLDGRFPGSDLASVYRNLDTLEQIGLVRHFHVAHGAGLYALAAKHQAGYVACEGCGAHRPLNTGTVARVAAVLREACGYEPQLLHFPVIGRCPECRDAHS